MSLRDHRCGYVLADGLLAKLFNFQAASNLLESGSLASGFPRKSSGEVDSDLARII